MTADVSKSAKVELMKKKLQYSFGKKKHEPGICFEKR